MAEGRQLEKEGNKKEAYQKFIQAISVTLEMTSEFLQLLIRYQVPYIIAPYESDAQMAFLARTGIVDAVITEDSDSLCYQCPCVLFKITPQGFCKRITLEDVYSTPAVNMNTWTPQLVELMCVLNGCDYAEGCNRIGLKTAVKYINEKETFEDTIKFISSKSVHKFEEFEEKMDFALSCFHHQVIFNPLSNQREYLTPVPPCVFEKYVKGKECHFGELKTKEIATQRAKGLISDDNGTLLLPKATNVDYLDRFFQGIQLCHVPNRFFISRPLRCVENMSDFQDDKLQSKKASTVQVCTGYKRSLQSIAEMDNKKLHNDSPTTVVPPDFYDSLLEDSLSDELLCEVERVASMIEEDA